MDLAQASVAQLLIPVTDLDRALPYDRDVLGLPFLFAAAPQTAFFPCGGVRLLVGVPDSAGHQQRGGTIHFRVEEIHAVHATLTKRGIAFQAAPHVVHRTPDGEFWFAEFADQDGNRLALLAETDVLSPQGKAD